MRKAVVIVVVALLAVMMGGSAATAQTCGGSLVCNTSSDAYTITNSGTGNVIIGEKGGPCSPGNVGVPSAGVIGAGAGNDGVVGYTDYGTAGVAGYNMNSVYCPATSAADGMLGVNRSGTLYGVYADGNIGATGTKSFVEPHPTDATKEIRYVSLEGPEAGTYFRGSGHTVNGFAAIQVPESFRLVTDRQGLTAVVTATGEMAQIAVISKSLDKIVIQSSRDVAFDYVVNGVRLAFKDFNPISRNDDFVPQGPDDNRFFAFPAETQRRLVATGIYNADGKVNLDKAREMGWDREWAQHKAVNDVLALFAQQHR